MKQILVKELMVPIGEYATVDENATLYEVVLALKQAQVRYLEQLGQKKVKYPHRAVLVLDKGGRVLGKVSQLDVLRALEPKYSDILRSRDLGRIAASGFSGDFLEDMMERYDLFNTSLRDLCHKASALSVKDFMYTPKEGEFVREGDTLGKAVHKLVIGHHQSLLVLGEGDVIVGVLRLVDVFETVAEAIEACKV